MLAYAGAAGKDQVIERQRTERLADLGISEHHAQLVRVEVAGHQLAEQLGRPRGQFGRFEHGGMPAGCIREQVQHGQWSSLVRTRSEIRHMAHIRWIYPENNRQPAHKRMSRMPGFSAFLKPPKVGLVIAPAPALQASQPVIAAFSVRRKTHEFHWRIPPE
nr:hypothetical protein [Pseudomonas asplenii]